ncbi:hypothetical protein J6590_055641 [Homalodisca vitripennis]|nr:hypothetical protein J6590_055641 [Homalodisca vitripennis]
MTVAKGDISATVAAMHTKYWWRAPRAVDVSVLEAIVLLECLRRRGEQLIAFCRQLAELNKTVTSPTPYLFWSPDTKRRVYATQ